MNPGHGRPEAAERGEEHAPIPSRPAWKFQARFELAKIPDVLFPPVCLHCGGLVEGSWLRHVCRDCAGGIAFAEGTPRAVAAVRFGGAARDLIHALKYRGARHALGDIERIFRRAPWFLPALRGAALVPVPLFPRRERERGFNQSRLIARSAARAAGAGTQVRAVLRRVLDTVPQAELDSRSRHSNLKNAFALAEGADLNPRLRYIIVDDVLTTGSTLEGCAEALRRAGARNVDAAAFALA